MADCYSGRGIGASLRGRERECKTLDGLLDRARDGRSAVMVLRGETGIGKTALLQYLMDRADEFTMARCIGVESEMELPFAGLHELCAPLIGGLHTLIEPQRRALSIALGLAGGKRPDQFLVALAALGILTEASRDTPVLCVVDDAQWLDQASARVLGFVGRRLLIQPIALVFAVRTPSTSLDHLAGLPELRLVGLDERSARALVASVAEPRVDETVHARIIEEAHGNPLTLLELGPGIGTANFAGGFALPDAANLPSNIRDQYLARLRELPEETQRLVVLAAAEPVGDTALLARAADRLGLGVDAGTSAVDAGLLTVGASVRFRHPLLRSAAYRAATIEERRVAHSALAAATDPGLDPDRRAWHRAYATSVPDETVAAELIASADRAQQRGGVASAAAFWERAVVLTPDLDNRASRALVAADAKYAAGDFEAAQKMLAVADNGFPDELGRVQVQRMRGQIAFALERGRAAPSLLLQAARRFVPLDGDLARETLLEAFVALVYAGRFADGDATAKAANEALLSTSGPEPLSHLQMLLRGLALRITEGYVVAAPLLKQALRQYRSRPPRLDWCSVACNMVAMELWDDTVWFELATAQAQLARSGGALSWLAFALDYLAESHIQAGELTEAAALMAERERIDPGIRATTLPYMALLLAAWRGDAPAAAPLIDALVAGASDRGEGVALTYAEYATAVLHNGLGNYTPAADAAHSACTAGELVISPWALSEFVEAAARSDKPQVAATACERLSAIAAVSGTDWARGVGACSRALIAADDVAEDIYREAIDLLSRTRMAAHLARARLCYGEWLRRQNRRVDARIQLRSAFDAFVSMGANAFGERARRELRASGETLRKRRVDPCVELTPREEQIAQLARQRRTNPEIGTQLFLSERTVEWHLRKIFTKLGIGSRRELDVALERHSHGVAMPATPPDR